jgi:hypothetical protein
VASAVPFSCIFLPDAQLHVRVVDVLNILTPSQTECSFRLPSTLQIKNTSTAINGIPNAVILGNRIQMHPHVPAEVLPLLHGRDLVVVWLERLCGTRGVFFLQSIGERRTRPPRKLSGWL